MQGTMATAELVASLVREIEAACPGRRIGRSTVQKMCFLLQGYCALDADFQLFHGGPNSAQVEEALDECRRNGTLAVATAGGRSTVHSIPIVDIIPVPEPVRRCVAAYAGYDDMELAIAASAAFIAERSGLGTDGLVSAVCSLDRRFGAMKVISVLSPLGLSNRSW